MTTARGRGTPRRSATSKREIKLVESELVEIGLAVETRSSQSQESSQSLVAGFAVSLATRVSTTHSLSRLEKLEKEGELLPAI